MEEPDCLLRVLRRFWLMAARFPPTLRCVALSAVCRLTIIEAPCNQVRRGAIALRTGCRAYASMMAPVFPERQQVRLNAFFK